MQKNASSKANSHSVSTLICILWNMKIDYNVHKLPALDPILSQVNPVYTLTLGFLKSQLNDTLPSMHRSPTWSLPFSFPNKNHVHISSLPCIMPCLSHHLPIITMENCSKLQ